MRHFLKIERMDLATNLSEIRKLFRDNGARPEEIHLVLEKHSSKHTGEAFIEFSDEAVMDIGLAVNGRTFKDKRVQVTLSNIDEFDAANLNVDQAAKPPARGARGGGRGVRGGRGGRGGFRGGRGGRGGFQNGGGPPERREISPDRGYTGGRGGRGFRGERGSRGGERGGRGGYRGSYGRGGGGRGSPPPPARRDDRQPEVHRGHRSRSPVDRRPPPPRDNSRDGRRNAAPAPRADPLGSINERKFVRMPTSDRPLSDLEIQNFFRPLLTRDIIYCRSPSGKTRSVLIEFFTEANAREAMAMNGKRLPNRQPSTILAPHKDEIIDALKNSMGGGPKGAPAAAAPADALTGALASLPGMDTAAQNPQVQQLLTLLTATVTSIAQAAAQPPVPQAPERGPPRRDDRRDGPPPRRDGPPPPRRDAPPPRRDDFAPAPARRDDFAPARRDDFAPAPRRDDFARDVRGRGRGRGGFRGRGAPRGAPRGGGTPRGRGRGRGAARGGGRPRSLSPKRRGASPARDQTEKELGMVGRVAQNANVDVSDIQAQRVVGIRNLPVKVSADELLRFFRGYQAVSDSVRIHYLEDGRCSGDAIISFRTKSDAKAAIGGLNKSMIDRQKVDLFLLS